jgi:hypothetical protein
VLLLLIISSFLLQILFVTALKRFRKDIFETKKYQDASGIQILEIVKDVV